MSDRICSVPDCETTSRARGLCNKHYRRLRRTGRIDMPNLEERFFAHVTEDPGGCWLFDKTNDKGYSSFTVNRAPVEGHRWCYIFLIGDVPVGLTLDHLCRVRACVNPWHLDVVPHRINILRGVGPAAVNARKTQCVSGHPFTSSNTYVSDDGKRQCRTCRARRARQYRRRS